jgi:hypothetical protein
MSVVHHSESFWNPEREFTIKSSWDSGTPEQVQVPCCFLHP